MKLFPLVQWGAYFGVIAWFSYRAWRLWQMEQKIVAALLETEKKIGDAVVRGDPIDILRAKGWLIGELMRIRKS